MLSYAYIIGTFPLSVHGAPPLQLGSIYGRVVQGLIFPVSCLLTLALFQSWAVSAAVTVSLVQANSLGTYKWDGKRGAAGGIVALQHTYICNFDEICQIHFHWRLSLWTPYGNFGVLAFPALPTPCYNYFPVDLEVGRAYCCGVPLNEVEHFSHLWAICVSSFVNSFDLPPTFLLHSWSFHLPLDDFQSPLHPQHFPGAPPFEATVCIFATQKSALDSGLMWPFSSTWHSWWPSLILPLSGSSFFLGVPPNF